MQEATYRFSKSNGKASAAAPGGGAQSSELAGTVIAGGKDIQVSRIYSVTIHVGQREPDLLSGH